jgi:hypothetical protein
MITIKKNLGVFSKKKIGALDKFKYLKRFVEKETNGRIKCLEGQITTWSSLQ